LRLWAPVTCPVWLRELEMIREPGAQAGVRGRKSSGKQCLDDLHP
jgi:hypothetical protein